MGVLLLRGGGKLFFRVIISFGLGPPEVALLVSIHPPTINLQNMTTLVLK